MSLEHDMNDHSEIRNWLALDQPHEQADKATVIKLIVNKYR
jgi:hypothetical protein